MLTELSLTGEITENFLLPFLDFYVLTNLTIISFIVDNIIKLLPFFKRKMSLREHQWKLRTKISFNAYETLYIYTRYCSKYLTHIISFSVQKHKGLFCRKVWGLRLKGLISFLWKMEKMARTSLVMLNKT